MSPSPSPSHEPSARPGFGTGRGKVLLFGEHAVVYGHPAIALAVDRCTHVRLTRRPGPTTVTSPHADPRVRAAVCEVVPEEGLDVEVRTDLPVGRGMGSSAALAVALAEAHADLRGEHLGPEALYHAAMPVERAFHGNPSGVDVAVAAWGGCLWFQPGDPPVRQPLQPGDWSVVVLDSQATGDTRALVAGVAGRRPGIDPALARIGQIARQARDVLDDGPALGELMAENHRLLREIGVSTPVLDDLVSLAVGAGAFGAKLSGAGGGGIVVALCADPAPVVEAAVAADVPAFGCQPWSR